MYDVLIIGAGIAGLQTAVRCAEQGLKVCVVDLENDPLFIPFKTCGSFMKIEEFGLSEKVFASTITTASISSSHITRKGHGLAHIIDKVQLHRELLEKLKGLKAEVYSNSPVIDVEITSEGIKSIKTKSGEVYSGKVVVDATGVIGLITKKVGLQDEKFKIAQGIEYNVKYLGNPNHAYLFIGSYFKGGYGWIFPVGNQRAIWGIGSFDEQLLPSVREQLDKSFEHPLLKDLVVKDSDKVEGGILPITEVKTKFIFKNLLGVGDSVSQVNPVVGEGYYFIMRFANMAADAIVTAIRLNDLSKLHQYEEVWAQKFGHNYRVAKKTQKALGQITKSDLLTDLGVMFLYTKRNDTVVRILSGEFGYKDLFLP